MIHLATMHEKYAVQPEKWIPAFAGTTGPLKIVVYKAPETINKGKKYHA